MTNAEGLKAVNELRKAVITRNAFSEHKELLYRDGKPTKLELSFRSLKALFS